MSDYKEILKNRESELISRLEGIKSNAPKLLIDHFPKPLLESTWNLDLVVASRMDEGFWQLARYDYMTSILDIENRLEGLTDIEEIITDDFLGEILNGDGETFVDGLWSFEIKKMVYRTGIYNNGLWKFNFTWDVVNVPFCLKSWEPLDWEEISYDVSDRSVILDNREVVFPVLIKIDKKMFYRMGITDDIIQQLWVLAEYASGGKSFSELGKFIGAFVILERNFRNTLSVEILEKLLSLGVYLRFGVKKDFQVTSNSDIYNQWKIQSNGLTEEQKRFVDLLASHLLPYNVIYSLEVS